MKKSSTTATSLASEGKTTLDSNTIITLHGTHYLIPNWCRHCDLPLYHVRFKVHSSFQEKNHYKYGGLLLSFVCYLVRYIYVKGWYKSVIIIKSFKATNVFLKNRVLLYIRGGKSSVAPSHGSIFFSELGGKSLLFLLLRVERNKTGDFYYAGQ